MPTSSRYSIALSSLLALTPHGPISFPKLNPLELRANMLWNYGFSHLFIAVSHLNLLHSHGAAIHVCNPGTSPLAFLANLRFLGLHCSAFPTPLINGRQAFHLQQVLSCALRSSIVGSRPHQLWRWPKYASQASERNILHVIMDGRAEGDWCLGGISYGVRIICDSVFKLRNTLHLFNITDGVH